MTHVLSANIQFSLTSRLHTAGNSIKTIQVEQQRLLSGEPYGMIRG